jgi:uncharacterized protein (TIGR02284 family)
MELKEDMTQLNNIHDLLIDSQKGYAEAAHKVEDPQVKDLLTHLSAGRERLIAEVEELRHRADPQAKDRTGGTLKGDLHRAWMAIRDALSSTENANILSECERGEEFLLMRYDEVLEKKEAPETFALATRQRAEVQGNLDRIKELRRIFENVEH